MRKFRTQSDCGFRMRHFASLLDAIFLARVMWEEVFKSSLKLRRVVNWLIVNVPMILQVKVVILCSVSHVVFYRVPFKCLVLIQRLLGGRVSVGNCSNSIVVSVVLVIPSSF